MSTTTRMPLKSLEAQVRGEAELCADACAVWLDRGHDGAALQLARRYRYLVDFANELKSMEVPR